MTAATMNNMDLILPGAGFETFLDYLFDAPRRSHKLQIKRVDVEDNWDANYKALENFHAEHGNLSVPFGKETGSLRSWTERQKKLHARSELEREKVDVLMALGFDFTVKPLSIRSVPSAATPAPAASAAKPDISKNIQGEESSEELKKEVKHGDAPLRVSPAKTPAVRKSVVDDEETWNMQLEALGAYRAKHGNCAVPFGKETGSLRSWTERQKRLHARSELGPQRVNDLKALDFDFTVKRLSTRSLVRDPAIKPSVAATAASTANRGSSINLKREESSDERTKMAKPGSIPPQAPPAEAFTHCDSSVVEQIRWNARHEDLKAYRSKYGDCDVPFGKEHGALRSWMERQRKLCKIDMLEPDKVEKMTELGFLF